MDQLTSLVGQNTFRNYCAPPKFLDGVKLGHGGFRERRTRAGLFDLIYPIFLVSDDNRNVIGSPGWSPLSSAGLFTLNGMVYCLHVTRNSFMRDNHLAVHLSAIHGTHP